MKKNIILGLSLMALVLSSCSQLDVTPKDEISDKKFVFTNPAATAQALAGVYSIMLQEDTWSALIPIRMEAATDISAARNLIAGGSPQNNSTTAQSASIENLWTRLYQGINAANEFIHYSAMYTPNSPTRTQNVCEARFLRAYYYFTLVRMFGDVPFKTDPTFELVNTDIARTSAVTIYDYIVKELTAIESVLAEPNAVIYGHISKTAAQATLADVYLNLAGTLMKNRISPDSLAGNLMYKRARDWSQKVINNPAHDITKTDYPTVFLNQVQQKDNLSEQVWELQFKYQRATTTYRTDNRIGKFNGMGGSVASSYIYFTPAMINLYLKDGEDNVRLDQNTPLYKYNKNKTDKKAATVLGSPVWTDTVAIADLNTNKMDWHDRGTGKWRVVYVPTDAEFRDNNYSGIRLSIYRIAELHLMLAEALNGLGEPDNAVKQINIVRKRAKAKLFPETANTMDGVFSIVVDERARELCFEGKRRLDLIRWGIYQKKIDEVKQSYVGKKISNSSAKANIPVGYNNYDDDMHQIFPIPQREIDNNALIPQSEQNKGWGGSRAWK